MERYHDIAGDPPRSDMLAKEVERLRLEQQMAEFLARGGEVQQLGHQMRKSPEPFVINPRTTPVYNEGIDQTKRFAEALTICFGLDAGGAK